MEGAQQRFTVFHDENTHIMRDTVLSACDPSFPFNPPTSLGEQYRHYSHCSEENIKV